MGQKFSDGVHTYEQGADGKYHLVASAGSAAPASGGLVIKPAPAPDPDKAVRSAILHMDLEAKARQAAKDAREDPAPIDPKLDALTGPAYLQHLPKPIAAQVQALADGRMAFPAGAGLRSPFWQQMLTHVAHFDPSFDSVNYNARAKTRADFTSGKSAQNITSFNTALGHLGTLWEASQALHNRRLPVWNAIANATERATGDPSVDNFNTARHAVVDELERAFRGSGGTEGGIEEWKKSINSSQSPEQLRSAIGQAVNLLQSRIEAIGQQYSQGMGKTTDPLTLLHPHAQAVFNALKPGGNGDLGAAAAPPTINGGGGSPGGPGGPGGGPEGFQGMVNRTAGTGTGSVDQNVAQGGYRDELDTQASAKLDSLIRAAAKRGGDPKAAADEIRNWYSQAYPNATPPSSLESAITYARQNPGYKGGFTRATKSVPNTILQRVSGSPLAAGSVGATNALMLGGMDEVGAGANALVGGDYTKTRDFLNSNKHILAESHPPASMIGDLAGTTASFVVPGMAFGRAAEGAKVAGLLRPLATDIGIGATRGALENNEDRLSGALFGGATAAGGGLVGRVAAVPLAAGARAVANTQAGEALINTVRRVAGKGPMAAAPASLTPAEQAVAAAANKAGPADIATQLQEAQSLGVPMALADTHPELTSLTGAAVRRSPSADNVAQTALNPRARGQIDRFGQAVERDLGPVGNVPQISADLQQQARTTAGPLYERAYAAPGTSSPKIDELLNTPFGRQALSRARTIAANERRDPTAMGFDLDPQGEVMLTRVPSVQTLDYVKRGMDDVLEQYRNPVTQRLHLDEAGMAQNGVKNELLAEMDRLNPDYAQARRAYAGPMQARDAMARGQDAVTQNPDTLGMTVAQQSPEQLGQMQLGYRGALMDAGNRLRYSSNPFDGTLGTPAAEARLATIHPNNPGVERILRQRDLEAKLAASRNDILGNSKTAQRGVADQAFAGGDLPQMAMDVGLNIATGQVPIGILARKGTIQAGKDLMKFGMGKRAVAKADEMAPMLLNTDPAASLAHLQELLDRGQMFRDAVVASRRRTGMVTAPLAAGAGLTSQY